jgi:hypothetical protein
VQGQLVNAEKHSACKFLRSTILTSRSNMTTTTDLQSFKTRNPLCQQDLFHCILDCLVAPEASLLQLGQSGPVLLSLAQTCRAISEPSLNRLWNKLSSLEPLIRCFSTVLSDERAKVGQFSRLDIFAHCSTCFDRRHHPRLNGLSFIGIRIASGSSTLVHSAGFLCYFCELRAHTLLCSYQT